MAPFFPVPDMAAPRPKVSVLVKSFNHASYIRQTIDSVLAQSFQDFEIIVTDDASRDDTVAVVESFDDPRIRLDVLARNGGISAAMNATIARSRGRYLAILNSDDWALPGRLERQAAFLDAHPEVSLVCGLARFVDETGTPRDLDFFREPLRFTDSSPRSWLRHFFLEGDNCICAPTVMLRREAYEQTGLYDLRLLNTQDFDMWTRMALAGHRFALIPEELTAYRLRDNEMNASSWSRRDVKLREVFEVSKILHHYTGLDQEQFEALFGDVAPRSDRPVALRVADLALKRACAGYRAFALDAYYAHAGPSDIGRLTLLTGSLDALGVLKAEEPFPQDVVAAAPGRWWRLRNWS